MKHLFFFICGVNILAPCALAYDLDLTQERHTLGRMSNDAAGNAARTIEVRRTRSTPEEVELRVSFDRLYQACAEERLRQVWEPGNCYGGGGAPGCWGNPYDPWCRGPGYPGGGYCTPGGYRTVRECLRYEWRTTVDTEDIQLDFEDAATLRGDEAEIFRIQLVQKSRTSDDFTISAQALQSTAQYTFEQDDDELEFNAE